MAKFNKKYIKLSENMNQRKKDIHNAALKEKTLHDQLGQGAAFVQTATDGTVNTLKFVSSILSENKNIPLVGFIFQMVLMVPKAYEVITDSKTSIPEKILAISFLGSIAALSIAAVVVGGLAAAIIGTVISSVVTVMEGIGLLGKAVEKYQLSKEFDKKTQFNELVNSKQIPEGDKYNQLFKIRAIELDHEIKNKHLNQEEIKKLNEERHFIAEVLKKKKISIEENKDLLSTSLEELYVNRNEKLTELVMLMDPASLDTDIEKIQLLQDEILELDDQIIEITAPIEKLTLDKLIANEKIASSFTNFSMATAGLAMSAIGILLILGSIAAPPFVLPAVVGLGIAMSAFSLIKWGAEKMAERLDTQSSEKKVEEHKESILDEALSGYEQQLENAAAATETVRVASPPIDIPANSSHEKCMQKLMAASTPEVVPEHKIDSPIEFLMEQSPAKKLDQHEFKKQIIAIKEAAISPREAVTAEEVNTNDIIPKPSL